MSNIFKTEHWLNLRDILFPGRCLGCGAGLQGSRVISFCQICLEDVRLILEPFCITCGKPFDKSAGKNHLCSYCLRNSWYFTRTRSAVYYQEPIAGAVRFFKYNGRMCGLDTFAALTRAYYSHHPMPEPELILPVPLHPKRLRKRGFNQALVLCRKLYSMHKKIIAPHILERHQWTKPQTGLKSAERKRNVKNAFKVKNPEKIKDKKILLVDDVFTTGATVNECARILLKKGAADVEVFTFTRATY